MVLLVLKCQSPRPGALTSHCFPFAAFVHPRTFFLAFCLRKYTPPYYYETRIILRNLEHERLTCSQRTLVREPPLLHGRSSEVTQAFRKTYEKCHEIQRDPWRRDGLPKRPDVLLPLADVSFIICFGRIEQVLCPA